MDNVKAIPPADFDGFLLVKHINQVTRQNFFGRVSMRNNKPEMFFTINDSMPPDIEARIQAAMSTYIHPADVGAARTLHEVLTNTHTVGVANE